MATPTTPPVPISSSPVENDDTKDDVPCQPEPDPSLPVTETGLQRLNSVLKSYESTSTPMHNLAARSSFSSISTQATSNKSQTYSRASRHKRQSSSTARLNSLTFGDQRHPGNARTRLGRVVETPEGSEDEGNYAGEMVEEGKRKRDSTGTGLSTNSGMSMMRTKERREKERLEKEALEKENLEREEKDMNYPKGWALPLLVTGICLSIFLISLDRTIITTAIPKITSEFRSYEDIGWYGSAYLLTACAFQPLYGRIYQLFNIKWSFLAATLIFELGSLVCGVAPNSIALIIGRAIAGLGSAGILTGSFVVVAHSVPLQARPIYTAAVGMMFGVGAVTGPLLGGVFTDLVSWRWCFYFNLPVGGATVLAMVFLFNPVSGPASKRHILDRISELDLIGNTILLGAAVMLFLALQYAETQYAWSSARVAGLLAGSGVTFAVFVAWQWWKAEWALIPPRIIKQRSVAASCVAAFFIYAVLLIHSYFLPIWFQAIKGSSAIASGVNMIAYMVANAVLSLIAGIVVSKNGYYTPPAILGCAIATVGCGLLSTLTVDTSSAKWIGYEILISAGLGMAIQQGFTAVQATLPLDEVPIGTAAVVAFQSLGGAIFVSVGNTILQTQLLSGTKDNIIPGVEGQAIIDAGASNFRGVVQESSLPALLMVYNSALQKVFLATIPLAALAMIGACCLEWKSVKSKPQLDDEAGKV